MAEIKLRCMTDRLKDFTSPNLEVYMIGDTVDDLQVNIQPQFSPAGYDGAPYRHIIIARFGKSNSILSDEQIESLKAQLSEIEPEWIESAYLKDLGVAAIQSPDGKVSTVTIEQITNLVFAIRKLTNNGNGG